MDNGTNINTFLKKPTTNVNQSGRVKPQDDYKCDSLSIFEAV